MRKFTLGMALMAGFLGGQEIGAVYSQPAFAQAPQQNEVVQLRRIIADQNVKLAALERELRNMTGRLEESEFASKKLQDDMTSVRRQLADLVIKQNTLADLLAKTLSGGMQKSEPDTDKTTAQNTPANSGAAGSATKPEAAPAKPAIALPNGSVAEQFDYAYQFVNKSDFKSARTALEQFLAKYPAEELTPNALFWLGRVHLIEKRPANAATNFLQIIENHQSHSKYAESLLDLADALIALDSGTEACNALADYRALTDVANPRLKAKESRLTTAAGC